MNCRKPQLGDRLAEERARLGKTQDEMAILCKSAKRTYCDYESGKSEPRGSFFELFAAIGGDIGYVITGKRTFCSLSHDEAALLDNFRAISDARKGSLVDVAEALSQKQRGEEKTGI